jgi:uncharacterized protein (TIGR00251 family)
VSDARRDARSGAGGAGSGLDVQERLGAVRFTVRARPRAARSEIAGVLGGALKVRLAAPPVEGAANAALIELLADELDVPRAAVRIISGATARSKLVEVTGIDARRLRSLFA